MLGTSPSGLRGRPNGGGKRWATWSDGRGPKAALRRMHGRGWGWEALLLLYICVEKIYHTGEGLTSSREVHYLNSWCRARETQTKENSQFQATLISCAGNSDAHLFLLLLAILGRTDKLAEVVSRTYSIFSLLLAKA